MTASTVISQETQAVTSDTIAGDFATWETGFDLWFTKLPAHTTRTYRIAWKELLAFTNKNPCEIESPDITNWVKDLCRQGRATSTVAQRCSAISAFYKFMQKEYAIVVPNLVRGVIRRTQQKAYGKAHFLDADGARALLAAIDRETLAGSRDYAMFLAFLFTGRRTSELRTLSWKDIETYSGHPIYRWTWKGKSHWDELPKPVYESIGIHLILVVCNGRDERLHFLWGGVVYLNRGQSDVRSVISIE